MRLNEDIKKNKFELSFSDIHAMENVALHSLRITA